MKRKSLGLWAGILMLTASAAFGQQHNTQSVAIIATGPGGSLVDYARQVSALRHEPVPVQFVGSCGSACTLYLTLPRSQVCIWPGARFVFHAAHGASRDFNQWGSEYMMARYPQWVQNWIRARGGLSDDLLYMSHAYASRFLPPCNSSGPTEQLARL